MTPLTLYAPSHAGHRRTWAPAVVALMLVFMTLSYLPLHFGLQSNALKAWFPDASWQHTVLSLVIGFGGSAVLCMAWIRGFERRGLHTIGFTRSGLGFYARGVLSGALAVVTCIALIYCFGGYSVETAGAIQQMSVATMAPLLCLLVGFAIQGATEEIFIRGWLFQNVAARYGLVMGIAVNALVFCVMHGGALSPTIESGVFVCNLVLFSVFMSLYAWREGSIWGICAWHSIWNFLTGPGMGLEISSHALPVLPLFVDLAETPSAAAWVTGANIGPEGSIITTGVLALYILYLLIAYSNTEFRKV
ncbi:MAG: type II CAAX endopeptidase family protein [Rhodoferax sp.]|nr:type II CAAX endopeptidase family protein [Rhodoferax sp.]